MALPASTMASAYRAGQSAGQNYVDIHRETNKYANKPNEINKVAYKAQIAEKKIATEINARAKKNEITAQSITDRAGVKADLYNKQKAADKSKRKAGIVAGIGMIASDMITENKIGKAPKRERDDFSSIDSYMESIKSKFEADRAKELAKPLDTSTASKSLNTSSTPTVSKSAASTNPAALNTSNNGKGGWGALSAVLSYGEGTQGDKGYTTQFTGTQFSDMSKHPRQLKSGGGYTSDAAGKYQFLSTTWDEAQKALNLPDFSPESQEKAGKFLTKRRGVDPDKVITSRDEFVGVMDKLAPEWASMPYSGVSPGGFGKGSSYYGQGGKNVDDLWARYQQNL